ncbi:hypothetical protein GUJ93_ZPchr0003g18502 [Zizania palustris]|uniref:Uncharacterized protein n=1 Tax=Zizania palustris TaxID=103762 RepID=A0A8J5S9P7_ZIZPA|nr:hypothetical protein GUJ93_ZPchr0003g18502 [Zizania palustris]
MARRRCARVSWDDLPDDERTRLHARQGIRYVGLEGLDVVDPKKMAPVPADGSSIGEIVMRGNGGYGVMTHEPKANAEAAFENGCFHSSDLGVKHPDPTGTSSHRGEGPGQRYHHLRRREHHYISSAWRWRKRSTCTRWCWRRLLSRADEQ